MVVPVGSAGADSEGFVVKEIKPGNLGGIPDHLTEFGGKLFFAADDGIMGRELWVSDGTAPGTVPHCQAHPAGEETWPAGQGQRSTEKKSQNPKGLVARQQRTLASEVRPLGV